MPECTCRTEIRNLSVRSGSTVILEDINLGFSCGELTAIIGPNGAGKTTLLRAILGEIPHGGTVSFLAPDGKPTRPRFGYVPQNVSFDRDAPVSVLDGMASALYGRPVWLGATPSQRGAVLSQLAIVDAAGIIDRRIGELSGGELQRMLLALAMTPVPNVLLLDEPVSAVDAAGMNRFYETACGLRDRFDLTVIIVSHDIAGIAPHADRMVLVSQRIRAEGTPAEMFASPEFGKVFGHLFQAVPECHERVHADLHHGEAHR